MWWYECCFTPEKCFKHIDRHILLNTVFDILFTQTNKYFMSLLFYLSGIIKPARKNTKKKRGVRPTLKY